MECFCCIHCEELGVHSFFRGRILGGSMIASDVAYLRDISVPNSLNELSVTLNSRKNKQQITYDHHADAELGNSS